MGKDLTENQKAVKLIPDSLLDQNEQVIFAIKPSLWLVLFFSLRIGAICLVMALLAMFFTSPPVSTYVIIGCGITIFIRVCIALLQWASRAYVLTDRRIIQTSGVLTVVVFQCKLSKIQNTFQVFPLLLRFFGLANIAFTTAGTGGVEAIWHLCPKPLGTHEIIVKTITENENI